MPFPGGVETDMVKGDTRKGGGTADKAVIKAHGAQVIVQKFFHGV